MRRTGMLWIPIVLMSWTLLQVAWPQQETAREAPVSASLRQALLKSLERGLTYLRQTQQADGSWEHHPGITGLAATAFLKRPHSHPDEPQPHVGNALSYLARLAKPDGGIYVRDLPNYNTAVAMMAFLASGKPEYQPLIKKAQHFLIGFQVDEEEGYSVQDKFYGGVGYGADLRPDLANLEYALQALKASALPASHPVWDKAIQFIQRTQNRSESNDQAWAGNDGGFVYYPGFSYAGATRSYGSMTYAGLLSYSYANVTKEDARVQAALRWIRQHYSVDENPGMGKKTLYYYYLVFAKALHAYGEALLTDVEGIRHNWRVDLGQKLLALQYPEGYWVNDDPSWWQDNKVLVTAFAVQTLEHILLD